MTRFAKNTSLHPEPRELCEPDQDDSRKNVNPFSAATKICHDPADHRPPFARENDVPEPQPVQRVARKNLGESRNDTRVRHNLL